jgi:hypothetical protein
LSCSYFGPSETAVEEGVIILPGDEKKMYAYELEADEKADIDAAVTPAVADL